MIRLPVGTANALIGCKELIQKNAFDEAYRIYMMRQFYAVNKNLVSLLLKNRNWQGES